MGVMPEMLVQTYIGAQLKHLTIKSVLVMIALIAATLAFSLILNKRSAGAASRWTRKIFDICTKKRTDNNSPLFLLFVKARIESVEIFAVKHILNKS